MALFGNKKDKTDKKEIKKDTSPAKESMRDLYKETPASSSGTDNSITYEQKAEAARILIKPLVTEKATNLSASHKYVFVVAASANKISVSRAIKAVYGIKPIKVNLINMKGKSIKRGQISGRRCDWRKAIVTLASGQSIKIYEGV